MRIAGSLNLVKVNLVALGDTPSDQLRSLREWLSHEDELRGAITILESAPEPDRLGPTVDALQVVAGSASTVLAAGLIAWLRTRVGRVRIVLKAGDGKEVEIDASTVRSLDAAALSALTADLIGTIDAATPAISREAGSGPLESAPEGPVT